MTEALFLADLHHPHVGDTVALRGEEGSHAAAVRRIRVGETITISDGAGTGVRGPVVEADKASVTIEVAEVLSAGVPDVRYHVVQALAKGDRSEQAVEMLTEIGADRIIPWQSSRSVVVDARPRGTSAGAVAFDGTRGHQTEQAPAGADRHGGHAHPRTGRADPADDRGADLARERSHDVV